MPRRRRHEARSEQVAIRFTIGEHAYVYDAAQQAGFRFVAPYARQRLLLDASSLVGRDGGRPDEDVRILHQEIRRVGVNLTQLVRHCHTHPGQAMPADLQPACEEVRSYLRRAFGHDR